MTRIWPLVRVTLCAVCIAAGGMVTLPFGPISFTLQTLFVYLSGLFLGPRHAVYTVALYVSAGFLGLPVFAGGKAGFEVLLGPTSGYLLGFFVATTAAGYAGQCTEPWKQLLGLAVAIVLLHTCGILGLVFSLHLSFAKALAIVLPFIPVDICKASIAYILWRYGIRCVYKIPRPVGMDVHPSS